jgi:hypothetical protein
MLEAPVLQMKGFKNVTEGEQVTGFQVRARCPYYRGIWASLIEGFEVAVDGETFPAESTRVEFDGKTFQPGGSQDEPEWRWPFEEPAVLTVQKPGGLEPGLHNVQLSVSWRWSYIPVEMQPTTNISERKLVLVR